MEPKPAATSLCDSPATLLRAFGGNAQHAAQVDLDAYFNHQRQVEYYCYNQQFHRKPVEVRTGPQQARFLYISLCAFTATREDSLFLP